MERLFRHRAVLRDDGRVEIGGADVRATGATQPQRGIAVIGRRRRGRRGSRALRESRMWRAKAGEQDKRAGQDRRQARGSGHNWKYVDGNVWHDNSSLPATAPEPIVFYCFYWQCWSKWVATPRFTQPRGRPSDANAAIAVRALQARKNTGGRRIGIAAQFRSYAQIYVLRANNPIGQGIGLAGHTTATQSDAR